MLGNGGAISLEPENSAFIIEDDFIVEMGPTILRNIKVQKLDINKFRYIYISHLHGDHILGFPFFLLHCRGGFREDLPIIIFIPANSKEYFYNLLELAYHNHPYIKDFKRNFTFVEISDNFNWEDDKYVLTTFSMEHMGEPTFGFRLILKSENRIIGYSADTILCEGLDKILQAPLDIMILDMNIPKGKKLPSRVHIDYEEAMQIRDDLLDDTILVLTHLYKVDDDIPEKNLFYAIAGRTFEI